MQAYRFYEQIADNYDLPAHQHFYQEVAGKLLQLIPDDLPVNSILEIGAGTGYTTSLLKQRFPNAKITALEPALAMLSKAKTRCCDVAYKCETLADFDSACFDSACFDLVACSMAGHWLTSNEWIKLENLASKSPLVMALPATPDEEKLPQANLLLRSLMLKLKAQPIWLKDSRRISFNNQLQTSILEEYASPEELTSSLYARGVFLSLFGHKAELAKNLFLSTVNRQPACRQARPSTVSSFHWSLKLIISYPSSINCQPSTRNRYFSG